MVVLEVLREFSAGTSIHGFTFLESPKSSSRTKIIWAIAIVVALSYASWEMRNSVISKYYCVFRTMKTIDYHYICINLFDEIWFWIRYLWESRPHLFSDKDVRFTTITFLQLVLSTAYSQASFSMHNPFIYVRIGPKWILTTNKLAQSVQYSFKLDQIWLFITDLHLV